MKKNCSDVTKYIMYYTLDVNGNCSTNDFDTISLSSTNFIISNMLSTSLTVSMTNVSCVNLNTSFIVISGTEFNNNDLSIINASYINSVNIINTSLSIIKQNIDHYNTCLLDLTNNMCNKIDLVNTSTIINLNNLNVIHNNFNPRNTKSYCSKSSSREQ
jgi:hypothetical protein